MSDLPDLARTAKHFATFADVVGHEVPLYRQLSRAIVEDEELLALAGLALPGQPPPNVLFAAVQFLILGGALHPLRSWYPALSGSGPPGDDPVPAFRDFCRQYRGELEQIIRSRRTQTNEVARCVALLPALAEIAGPANRPLALIEIGASAGLLLGFDRYRYAYARRSWGPPNASVRLPTTVRGSAPPLPSGTLRIVSRLGIDLHPLDVTSETDVRWLDSLIWPGHAGRRRRLHNAVDSMAVDPPPLWAADALEALPAAIAAVDGSVLPVVFHSFTLIQWSRSERARLDRLLRESDRPVTRIGLEWVDYRRSLPAILRSDYRNGAGEAATLGRFHHHGAWIEWGWKGPPSGS